MPQTGFIGLYWAADNETTWDDAYAQDSEDVFSLEITETEGEAPSASVEVVNPGTGLLASGRRKFVWIWIEDGTEAAPDPQPLFYGRLAGFPRDSSGEMVTLEFVTRPSGWKAALDALATSLKVAPYYDALFVSPDKRDDPAEALGGRTSLYYWPRTTGTVTTTDILAGGSTVNIAGNYFRDSLRMSVSSETVTAINLSVEAQWEQKATGFGDVYPTIANSFALGIINTLTPEAIENGWPQPGDTLGGATGYQVTSSRLRRREAPSNRTTYPTRSVELLAAVEDYPYADPARDAVSETRVLTFERVYFEGWLNVSWEYTQRRKETISATVEADVQALTFDDGGAEDMALRLEDITESSVAAWEQSKAYVIGNQVRHGLFAYECAINHTSDLDFWKDYQASPAKWALLAVDGSALGDVRRPSFFLTARGKQAWEHALCRARARLVAAARAIEISFETTLDQGRALDCNKSVTISDSRLPGGTATGKVKELRLIAGEGERRAEVTLAVAVGNNTSVSSGAGSPTWANAGYVGADYQAYTGGATQVISGLVYDDYATQTPPQPVNPLTLTAGNIIRAITIGGDPASQNTYVKAREYPIRRNLDAVLAEIPTIIDLEMVPLTGQDEIAHEIEVTMTGAAQIPKQIDLSAS